MLFSQLLKEQAPLQGLFRFILFAMGCSFFIALEYGITRPASNAFFVSFFGASSYPYVWLCTVPLNFLVITLYSRALPKLGCSFVMALVIFLVISMSLITFLWIEKKPFVSFLHYVWKDIYILLMFKQLWSLIHSTVCTKKARYLYGLFFGIGGLGSVMGSMLPGFFAVSLGSKTLFLATIPAYLILLFLYQGALFQSKRRFGFSEEFSPLKKSAFSLVWKRKFLFYILAIVVFMQISVAFVEYEFNYYLERAINTVDSRTEYCGKIFSMINTMTTIFQVLGGGLLIQMLGLRWCHRVIPCIFLLEGACFFSFPSFRTISLSFMSIKSIDHSFFGIVREMLYIPLTKEETFQAKAVIDVFAYRSAKALAALILLTLQLLAPEKIVLFVSAGSFCIFLFWLVVTFQMFQRDSIWREEVPFKEAPSVQKSRDAR